MTIVLLIFTILCCVNMKFAGEGTFFKDYISIGRTNAVKGIFVILVFMRHFLQYIAHDGIYDQFATIFDRNLSQLLVTMFLFYSGYGVMKSISKKGASYVKSMPGRSLKLLLRFDVGVAMYLIILLALHTKLTGMQILQAFLCWESIGNSNWYIFVMIMMYLITFPAFLLIVFFLKNDKKNEKIFYFIGAILLTALTFATILVLKQYRDTWWYNTMLCYPLGVWFALLQKPFETIVMKNGVIYYCVALVLFTSFILLHSKRNDGLKYYELMSLVFCLLVVVITMKIRFDNEFLQFLGKHVFSIYILQRIPMFFLSYFGFFVGHPYSGFVFSFLATLMISVLYDDYLIPKIPYL